MNAAISMPIYGPPAHSFANGIVQGVRRLGLKTEAFYSTSLAPAGIADSVNRIVIGRSATLSPALRQRVGQLSDLENNWDGEAAKPVKAPVLGDAVEFLRRLTQQTNSLREPFLAPTFDGFIQIEWHDKKRSLEIEAVSMGWSAVGSLTGKDNQRLYFEGECDRSDFEQLVKFYEWFVGNELIWPSR